MIWALLPGLEAGILGRELSESTLTAKTRMPLASAKLNPIIGAEISWRASITAWKRISRPARRCRTGEPSRALEPDSGQRHLGCGCGLLPGPGPLDPGFVGGLVEVEAEVASPHLVGIADRLDPPVVEQHRSVAVLCPPMRMSWVTRITVRSESRISVNTSAHFCWKAASPTASTSSTSRMSVSACEHHREGEPHLHAGGVVLQLHVDELAQPGELEHAVGLRLRPLFGSTPSLRRSGRCSPRRSAPD